MTPPTDYLSILHLTDLHLLSNPDDTLLGVNTAHYFHAVLEQALAERSPVDLILLTGDLAQEACAASYNYLLNSLEALQIPCLCLPGNHDDVSLMETILSGKRVNCGKQLILNNWQIIGLNSQMPGATGGRLTDKELMLLKRCLNDYPDHHALIAVHHHCLPTHSAWMDAMMIENSDEFLSIVGDHAQSKIIVNGHIHQLMDKNVDDIRILATPSTCFQFAPASRTFKVNNAAPAYRIIKLYGDGEMATEVTALQESLQGLQLNNSGY